MIGLTIKRAEEIISRFPDKKILVIGDLILDEYIWGSVDRISPEAPVPVVAANRRSYMPGGAANVARNLRDLGVCVSVVGGVGTDDVGDNIVRILEEKKIDVDGIIRFDERPSTVKTRIIGQHQQIVRIDWEDAEDIDTAVVDKITNYVVSVRDELDAVIFEDYGKGIITQQVVQRVLSVLDGAGIITSYDPKRGHFLNLNGISIATPNHAEAYDAMGITKPIDLTILDDVGEGLLAKWGVDALLVTLGEHGMSLFERGKPCYKISTMAREVYDVSGAGDTVIASLTAAMASGASFAESAIFSNFAAGVVVGKVGTASVVPKEILDAIKCR